jgi:hypothetical protein
LRALAFDFAFVARFLVPRFAAAFLFDFAIVYPFAVASRDDEAV